MLFGDYYCDLGRHFLEHQPSYFNLRLQHILISRRLFPRCKNFVKFFSFCDFLNFGFLSGKFEWERVFIDFCLSITGHYLKSGLKHVQGYCVNDVFVIWLNLFLIECWSLKRTLLWIWVWILIMPSFLHSMCCYSQVYQLNRSFNFGVDIFNLAKFRTGKHIFDIAPPIALLADFLQHLTSLL